MAVTLDLLLFCLELQGTVQYAYMYFALKNIKAAPMLVIMLVLRRKGQPPV